MTLVTAAFDEMSERHERWRTESEAHGRKTAGPISRQFDVGVRRSYAGLLRQSGRLAEAEAIYRQILVAQAAETESSPLMTEGPAVGRALAVALTAEQRSSVLADLAAVLREAGRDAEAAPLAAEADQLAARAAKLRARVEGIWNRQAALLDREERISIEELRRLLATPLNDAPATSS
jgi:hypothetical protein